MFLAQVNTVCFAYYADDEFIGWHYDTFGKLYKLPKVYDKGDKDLISKLYFFFLEHLVTLRLFNMQTARESEIRLLQSCNINFLKAKKKEIKAVQTPFVFNLFKKKLIKESELLSWADTKPTNFEFIITL